MLQVALDCARGFARSRQVQQRNAHDVSASIFPARDSILSAIAPQLCGMHTVRCSCVLANICLRSLLRSLLRLSVQHVCKCSDITMLQVKLALALMLCGGVQRTDEGGTKVKSVDYSSCC